MRATAEGLVSGPRALTTARLLALALVGYVLAYAALSVYKFETYRQGFDLGQNEQIIWNTAHGRPFETSTFVVMKYDFDDGPVPLELLLAVPYALVPTTATLLVLQTLALAAGAIPLYRLGVEKIGPWPALFIALAYLFHVTVTRTNLYEFQLRSFVLPFFLWAFYSMERRAFGRFVLFGALALACKSEVALTLPMFGVYAWLTHRSPRWVVTPVVMGAAWFVFVFAYVIPTFVPGNFIASVYGYGWLGNSFGAMLATLVTRPGYVLQNVLTGPKLEYVFQSLLLLLFLPLLQPRLLIFAAPNLAQNLLAVRPVQYSVLYFYQAFIVGAFFLAVIYGIGETVPRLAGRRTARLQVAIPLALLAASVFFNLTWNNLALRAVKGPEPPERRAAAARILARIPATAPVAASLFLGPHLAQRQELDFFPGDASYPFPPERVQYVAVDLQVDKGTEAQGAIAALKADPAWRVESEDTGYVLFARASP